jgi:histidinol-phosphate aminotransferase
MNPFLSLATAGVQQLIPYVPGKPVEALQRELGLSDIVKLASNENPLPISPLVNQAIQQALSELGRYPDGSGFALKARLAAHLGCDSQCITLGNGSSEILELVMRTFVTPEHSVVFSQHAFALYPILTQAVGAKPRIAPALDYGHNLAAMRALVSDDTRVVFIANPNNPTGTLLAADAVEAFIADLPATVLCVLDEAYFEFVDPLQRADSLLWLTRYPNLIITRTFSKAYGLAGLRIGYGVSSPDIADLLNRVRQPFNNNVMALVAAEAALQDSAFLNQTIAINQAGMQQLTHAFEAMGLAWIPSAGNFVAVDLQQPGLPIYEALLQQGVIVRPVANYDMPQHLRISIGSEFENAQCIKALKQVLARV